MKIILIICLLLGCNSVQTQHFTYNCFKHIESDIDLDKAKLDYNFHLAESILVKNRLIPQEEMCNLGEVSIHISKRYEWDCHEQEGVDLCTVGYYSIFTGIELNRDTKSLVHELLHLWDSSYLQPGTLVHANWDKNGYDSADLEYEKKYSNPTFD